MIQQWEESWQKRRPWESFKVQTITDQIVSLSPTLPLQDRNILWTAEKSWNFWKYK